MSWQPCLRAALAVGVAGWLAGDSLAQGPPGGGGGRGMGPPGMGGPGGMGQRGGRGGGMGQAGGGPGGTGGQCGRGTGTSQMTGSPGMTADLRGSPTNQAARTQQLAALQAYQSQFQAAQLQANRRQAAWLRTSPRQGAERAEMSPAWTSSTLVAGPTATVTPDKAPVPMAVSPPLLTAYRIASDAGLSKSVRKYVRDAEVLLVEEPLAVVVETRFRGLAYVRPTEGDAAGKFFVVEERYVK